MAVMCCAMSENQEAILPPHIQSWFAGQGWAPHPNQLAMIEAAQAGLHAMLVAPTGGWKTLS
ncbi:MAG: hypothetical protein AAF337_14865, partial [Pseudomonadota bacterium]